MKQLISGRSARLVQALVIAMVVCASLGAADSDARFNKVGAQLMCTCGCAQTLLGCDHVGCPNRSGEMEELRGGISSGQSDAAILQGFVTEYGKVVLGAPPKEGFDLVAWIMPFAVSALALIGTIFLVRNWARSQSRLAAATVGTPAHIEADDAMRERIRRDTETG